MNRAHYSYLRLVIPLVQLVLAAAFCLFLNGCTAQNGGPVAARTDPTSALSAPTPNPGVTPTVSGPDQGISLTQLASTPVPTAISSSKCSDTEGKTSREYINTKTLPGQLYYTLYLPPCYDQNTTEKYPVIYLFHGISYKDDQWVRLGMTRAADKMIASGQIPPVILVFPYNYDWRQPNESQFGNAVAQALIPWIDQNYRTVADREHRAIGGLSRGAGWAVHLGLTRWDLFSQIGAHSLSLLRVDESKLDDLFKTLPSSKLPEMYLDAGNDDPERENIENFTTYLKKWNIPFEFYVQPGEHDEAYWSAHISEYLLWYAHNW
jgi:enterochelin esterase-like enzyme